MVIGNTSICAPEGSPSTKSITAKFCNNLAIVWKCPFVMRLRWTQPASVTHWKRGTLSLKASRVKLAFKVREYSGTS